MNHEKNSGSWLSGRSVFESLWNDPQFKAIVKRAQDEKAVLRAQILEMEKRGEWKL